MQIKMWHIVAGYYLVYRAKKSCPFSLVPLTFTLGKSLFIAKFLYCS